MTKNDYRCNASDGVNILTYQESTEIREPLMGAMRGLACEVKGCARGTPMDELYSSCIILKYDAWDDSKGAMGIGWHKG